LPGPELNELPLGERTAEGTPRQHQSGDAVRGADGAGDSMAVQVYRHLVGGDVRARALGPGQVRLACRTMLALICWPQTKVGVVARAGDIPSAGEMASTSSPAPTSGTARRT